MAIRNPFLPVVDALARGLVKLGVSANEVTLSGFIIGVWALLMLPYGHYYIAIAFILLNRLTAALDGAVARQTKQTVFGYYLETILDVMFYAGLFFCFGLGQPDYVMMIDFVLFSFVACQISRLALKLLIEHERDKKEKLSPHERLGGIMNQSESLITVLLICLFPHSFVVIGLVYSALCWVTAIGHMLYARRVLA